MAEAITPETPYLLDPAFNNLSGRNRNERALNIFNTSKSIKKLHPNQWTVKSQNSPSVYTVTRDGDKFTCNCPDCILNKNECKHILAVKMSISEAETKVEHHQVERDWTNYNLGQMKEGEYFDLFLKELAGTVESPEQHRGRKAISYSDKIFCAVKKVSNMKSLRRTQAAFNEAETEGLIDHSLHFNTVSYFLRDPRATAVLHQLIRLSASLLAEIETSFSIDSSGFRTTQFGEWCDTKHGKKFTAKNGDTMKARREHKWLKCHISSGNTTNIISDVIITNNDGEGTGDSTQFVPLLNNTARFFDVKEICADAAYVDRNNFAKADELGAEPFIYFKKNANGNSKGCPAWTQAFVKFISEHDEFMKHYNKRNNVESTFGALKGKFGEIIKSKDEVSQVNELLCKVLAYNISVLVSAMFVHDTKVNF